MFTTDIFFRPKGYEDPFLHTIYEYPFSQQKKISYPRIRQKNHGLLNHRKGRKEREQNFSTLSKEKNSIVL